MKQPLQIRALVGFILPLSLAGSFALADQATPAATAAPVAASGEAKMEPIPSHIETTISNLDNHDQIEFRMVRETKVEGTHTLLKNTFTDKDGKEVVTETAEMENGHIISFHQDQKQWGSTGDVVVKDGKVKFTYTRDGKTKTDDDKAGSDFVMTASLMDYMREHWADVAKGKAVKFKLGVLDRLEVISFQIKRDKEITYADKPAYILKMTPTSVFISALVAPIYFTTTSDGNRLWEIDGRTPMKYKSGDSWKNFDGHTLYKY